LQTDMPNSEATCLGMPQIDNQLASLHAHMPKAVVSFVLMIPSLPKNSSRLFWTGVPVSRMRR
jgi:hypothetical protein